MKIYEDADAGVCVVLELKESRDLVDALAKACEHRLGGLSKKSRAYKLAKILEANLPYSRS